ncbi:LysR substrate binding domain-containing protein [Williamsia serinedens]|uniref:LysR substrate binding domain-containing protein n=1 Tax=Williamsia serinedens TaxID=391736 RepID=A0ABT1HAS0_9NOCA|nr:LysR substrate binding domain-containing protein [Williamsia serinedens]
MGARDAIDPAELADADVISLPEGTGARTALDEVLGGATARRPRWEVATPATALGLAARGLGVAVLSRTTGRGATGVVDVGIDDPRARSSLGIVWRDGPGPATRALLERLLPAASGS